MARDALPVIPEAFQLPVVVLTVYPKVVSEVMEIDGGNPAIRYATAVSLVPLFVPLLVHFFRFFH